MDVIYAVDLEIDREIGDVYRAWLAVHIDAMLTLPGFVGATCYERVEPAPPPGRFALCVQYRLRDRAALDAYLQQHAAQMRADGLTRFAGRFDARRRILLPASESVA